MLIREKLVNLIKGFSVQKQGKKQFRRTQGNLRATNNSELKQKGLLIYNPKTIICEAQAIKAGSKFPKLKQENEKNGCSSEKERKVNALALRADEGRDNLR